MTDRRRTPRYVLSTPLPADAAPMHDVTVEQFAKGRAVVIAPLAHQRGDALVMHVTTRVGLRSHPATVLSSSPVTFGGALQFRVELRVDEASQDRVGQECSERQ